MSARHCGAAAVLIGAAVLVNAASPAPARPRYGGTLRVELSGAVRALDPDAVGGDAEETAARSAVLPAVFETLVRVDSNGIEPLLAESWDRNTEGTRWQFRLRSGVRLHDGTILAASQVASLLASHNPQWRVRDDGDRIVIESDHPVTDMPWDLADERRAIAIVTASGMPLGTGPFRIDRWEPGRRLVLTANDGYRGGRPFLDAVQIDMAENADHLAALEGGRADFVSLLPQDVRRASQRGARIVASRPHDLVALVFDTRRPAASQEPLRRAVAAAIDRRSMCAVLLQHHGTVADALLPEWLAGYTSLLAARDDRSVARAIAPSLPAAARSLSIEYPPVDRVAAAIADRVAVDLRDAGFTPRVGPAPAAAALPPDARLLRAAIDVTTADRAIASVLVPLGLDRRQAAGVGAPLDETARFEQALLERHVVVPLVHLSRVFAVNQRAECASASFVSDAGTVRLADIWLRGDR